MTEENQDITNDAYSILLDIDMIVHMKEVNKLIEVNTFFLNSALCNTKEKKRITGIYLRALEHYLVSIEKEVRKENDNQA